jgi:tetratricopeptide (TPR) repeat protein
MIQANNQYIGYLIRYRSRQLLAMQYHLQRLLPVQLAIVSSLCAASWHDPYARGRGEFDRGLYAQAITDYTCALGLAEASRDRAVILYSLALAHATSGELLQAEQDYRKALDIFRREGNSVELALALAGLGDIHREQHDLDDALAAERQALAILELLGKGDTHQAADVLIITGEVLSDQRRFKAAQRCTEEGLAIYERTLGPEHPDFAAGLNNLGVIELERRHAAAAETLFERALGIRLASLGPEHPLTAATLRSLASAHAAKKGHPLLPASHR